MADHRKTLQAGTPAAAQPQPAAPVAAPQSQYAGRPPMSSQPEPSSDLPLRPLGVSQIPPPIAKDALARTPPPVGTRTPEPQHKAPDFLAPLPANAPGWMVRARRLSLALEEAVRQGNCTPALEACIERAWAAWELDGFSDKHIARVAQLMETAHVAIRDARADRLEQAYHDVAQVVWAGLPRTVKGKATYDGIMSIVRELRTKADPWAAAVDSTAQVLGWSDSGRAHAAHALRVALLARS